MRNPLHELDQLHASTRTKVNTLNNVVKHKKKSTRKWIPVGFAFIAACTAFILWLYLPKEAGPSIPSASSAIITLDINPSIELHLDNKQRIIETKAYNKEGSALLKGMNLKEKELDEALALFLDDEQWQSYLMNGFLEIGVYSSDSAYSAQLESEIGTYLDKSIASQHYHCASIDEETHNEARQHHTSQGKYRVIDLIRSYDDSYSIEELSNKSMSELYTLLETYDTTTLPEEYQYNEEDKSHHHHSR